MYILQKIKTKDKKKKYNSIQVNVSHAIILL